MGSELICSRHSADALVSDHDLYRRLGPNAQARGQVYRGLFRAALAEELLDAVRAATKWWMGARRRALQAAPRQGATPAGCAAAEGVTEESAHGRSPIEFARV